MQDDATIAKGYRLTKVPEKGTPIDQYATRLQTVVEESVRVSSPYFIGHMTSALPYFVRPLSRLLTSLNQNLVKVETAQALTPYEREALAIMHRLIFNESDAFYDAHVQDPASTLGIVTSGGTLANITGLWIARNRAFGPEGGFEGVEKVGMGEALKHAKAERTVIIGSALMHYSLEKAVDLLGIGSSASFVRVPVDGQNRVRMDELEKTARECQGRGDKIVALVGIAGTTDAGSIDPLPEIAALAKELGVHFHVDAAWGGPLAFSDKYKSRLKGLELADSVTIDGHKQLYLPMGIGMVLLRDPMSAGYIEKQAQYIIRKGSPDLGRRALEGSRPGMALYLHAALHLFGREGYAELVEDGVDKTMYLAEKLKAHPAFELFAEPQMNILNYRFIPERFREAVASGNVSDEDQEAINRANVRLQEEQRRRGETFVSRTTLRVTKYGENRPISALRVVLANPLTREAHIDATLEHQVKLAAEIAE